MIKDSTAAVCSNFRFLVSLHPRCFTTAQLPIAGAMCGQDLDSWEPITAGKSPTLSTDLGGFVVWLFDWRSEVGLLARSENIYQVRILDSRRAEDLDVFHTVHIEQNVPLAPIGIGLRCPVGDLS
jgi:hypothetical protein